MLLLSFIGCGMGLLPSIDSSESERLFRSIIYGVVGLITPLLISALNRNRKRR